MSSPNTKKSQNEGKQSEMRSIVLKDAAAGIRNGIVLCLLIGSASTLHAQTFTGPGPDEACGGTELAVAEKQGRVSCIQETVFASNRTIVEQYRPLTGNDWQITLLLYKSRWQQNEPLTKDRLLRSSTFAASDITKAERLKDVFGYGDIKWSDEPKRLLEYYHANRSKFQR
jgi:hypothetical protein